MKMGSLEDVRDGRWGLDEVRRTFYEGLAKSRRIRNRRRRRHGRRQFIDFRCSRRRDVCVLHPNTERGREQERKRERERPSALRACVLQTTGLWFASSSSASYSTKQPTRNIRLGWCVLATAALALTSSETSILYIPLQSDFSNRVTTARYSIFMLAILFHSP